MKITEARIRMSNGDEALYVGEGGDAQPGWPFLAIHVESIDEARDLIDTLERSRARKKAREEESQPLPPMGPPQEAIRPDDPPCPAHADGRHNTVGGACLCGYGATPKEQGKARAKGIRESMEPGTAA